MAVEVSDIEFRLSGGAANADTDASIGGAMSSESIVNNTVANLFDNVSAGEASAGSVEYRCFYILNAHDTDTLDSAAIYIHSNTPAEDTAIAIGLDPAGIGDGSSTGVADEPGDEVTAPDGVTFSAPGDEGSALAIGTLEAGEAIAVWVRRTVDAEASSVANDPATLRVIGTPA